MGTYEDGIEEREEEVETCEHGLSAWLCADPINHYPPDNGPLW